LGSQIVHPQNREFKPIEIWLTWLDHETVVLAFRNPDSKRVIMGIARPADKVDQNPGHLYQIPGLKEAISDDLSGLRTALMESPGGSGKFLVHRISREGNVDFTFNQIDPAFYDYISKENKAAGDLTVWEVKETSASTLARVAFLGDLTLVTNPRAATPQAKTENAIVELLAKLAVSDIRVVTLQGGCESARQKIEKVKTDPRSIEARKDLHSAMTGTIGNRPGEDNEYEVTNNGWSRSLLRLEINPQPRDFSVISSLDNQEITNRESVLELPPCSGISISISSRNWYETFSRPTKFSYSAGTLTADVPELEYRWILIVSGLIVLLTVGLIVTLFVLSKRDQTPLMEEKKRANLESVKKIQGYSPTLNLTAINPDSSGPTRGSGWKFWRKRKPSVQLPQEASTTSQDAPPESSSEKKTPPDQTNIDSLTSLLEEMGTIDERRRLLHATLVEKVQAKLQYLQSSEERERERLNLQQQYQQIETEHTRWVQLLAPNGGGPEEIQEHLQRLTTQLKNVEGQVSQIQALFGDGNRRTEGGQADLVHTLKQLHRDVDNLAKLNQRYGRVTTEISKALNPNHETSMDSRFQVEQLAVEVTSLRQFTDRVLQTYAGPLQFEGDAEDFASRSVVELQTRFDDLFKAADALRVLAVDVRIDRAQIVHHAIATAGRILLELARETPEYALLLTGTRMELSGLGEDLISAAESAERILRTALSKQAKLANGGGVPSADSIDKILIPFIDSLLSNPAYMSILNMLRLWQTIQAYCRDSTEPAAVNLFERSVAFRVTCERIISDFAHLDVHFHPIRFLSDPDLDGLIFTAVEGVPRVQSSAKLINPFLEKLDLYFDRYWKTVADVNSWGFDCKLVPSLNCETKLWLWRSISKGAAEGHSKHIEII
jgi:hypothetical protein